MIVAWEQALIYIYYTYKKNDKLWVQIVVIETGLGQD